MTTTRHKEFAHIISVLKESPRGMSVKQIAEAIGMNRISVARYLDIMRTSGQVEMEPYGQAKVYFLSKRIPISAMLNFSSDYFVVLGDDYRIAEANTNFVALVGKKKEDILNRSIIDIIHPLSESINLNEVISRAMEGKTDTEEIRITKDGEEFSFRMKIIPTAFLDGNPGIAIVLEDVTEYLRTIDALRESENKFRKLVESLSDLLVTVDEVGRLNENIRNPLQAIVGIADLEGGDLGDKVISQAREIDEIIQQVNIGRRESENFRAILKKYYPISEEKESTEA